MAVGVPGVVVEAVVGYIAVVVVRGGESGDGGHTVCGSRVRRLELVGAAGFVDVAEGGVGERLCRGAPAVGARRACNIIVLVATVLGIGRIEAVGDVLRLKGPVRVPAEGGGQRRAIDRELVLRHSVC